MSTLQSLAQIITNGVNNIEATSASRGEVYPMLDDAYSRQNDLIQNRYAADSAPIIAAAYQLIATLTHPDPYLFNWGMASFFSVSIAAVGESYIPDILREAGPEGLHVEDIASQNGMDPDKIGRMLRLLALRHVFVEVLPDVFRNNRVSAALCTGKSVPEMQAKPLEKWDGTNGVSAMGEFLGVDGAKMASYLVETVTDPDTALSKEPDQCSAQRGLKTHLNYHSWLQQPENKINSARFQNGMRCLTHYASEELPEGGFEWTLLPEKSVVVDVGGGIGTVTMDLAAQHKHLRYVIEDLPAVIEQTRTYWSSKMPHLLANGTVSLKAHSFFDPQPITDAAVFVVRYCLHNWPDAYCARILKHLRAAAQPTTKLIVLEQIVDYLSRDTASVEIDIPGASRPKADEPLLPYPDAIAGYAYSLDVLMMGELNSQGRSLKQFSDMFQAEGWKLERVYQFVAPHPQQLVCSPRNQRLPSPASSR